ncbi:MAG: SDR family NAD(P)-dependent oxidoreductase [Gammaproteobacteria bacterium]|nr:SDR family NAD(P)-dependent oxidoreductase [Gammaproteobacteria bacterium]
MDGDMQGKVCLVTGGARGMGRVTALALAARGARVIIVDWEGEEGTRTRDLINSRASRPLAEFAWCDLSSLADVRRLAADIGARYPSLQVLVNNAGITDPVRRLSPDGWEMHLATCHLGHFLLTQLLLPQLRAGAPARIVCIASEAHRVGPGLDFDDLNNEKIWKGAAFSNGAAFAAYHRAKLCNLYFTFELAGRLRGSGITVNAVSPGYFVNTSIYRNLRGVFRWGAVPVFALGSLLGLNTPERGARTHIHVAASPAVEGVTGEYFASCRVAQASPVARDPVIRRRLWDWTAGVTGIGA